ncbi:MAG: hypothetical protein IJI45_05510, partial [Anaerolineaceae bacterium]|nr:hypothetical protein [Anaerolineaceae bacterium]
YVRGSMSTLQILLFPCFYSVWSPTLSREEPFFFSISRRTLLSIGSSGTSVLIIIAISFCLDQGIAAKRRKGKALVHRNTMQGGCGIRVPLSSASQSAHTGQQG